MKINKNDIIFSLGLLTAIWFAVVGMIWIYWIALVIAYPIGIISFILWRLIKLGLSLEWVFH